MDAIDALIGEISDFLGLNQTEVVADLKDGDNWKSGSEIKSYFNPKITDKLKSFVSNDKLEQARGRARKEAFEEIEKKISSELGIKGRFDTDLIDNIKAATEKPADLDPEKIENSQYVKDLQKQHREEVKRIKKENLTKVQEIEQGRVKDKLYEKVEAFITDEKNGYIIPSEKVLSKQINHMVNELLSYKHEGEDVQFSLEDNKLKVTDSDGITLQDEKLNPLSPTGIFKRVAEEGYFEVQANSKRTTASTKETGTTEPTVIKFGDNKEVSLPTTFKSEEEMNDYFFTDEGRSLSAEERSAVRTAHEGKFE